MCISVHSNYQDFTILFDKVNLNIYFLLSMINFSFLKACRLVIYILYFQSPKQGEGMRMLWVIIQDLWRIWLLSLAVLLVGSALGIIMRERELVTGVETRKKTLTAEILLLMFPFIISKKRQLQIQGMLTKQAAPRGLGPEKPNIGSLIEWPCNSSSNSECS